MPASKTDAPLVNGAGQDRWYLVFVGENGGKLRLRQDNVTWREVGGEIIALDLTSSKYFTTNKTGALLWHALIEGTTHDHLVGLLQQRFGVAENQAVTDIAAFLALIDRNGLLQHDK